MPKPIVSVIVPVYNEVDYIEPMIESILQQRQDNLTLELLIVDGNSEDGTKEKIFKIQQENPAIRIVHNEKRIAPVAFNKGIHASTGDYIAILGAHSKYDPGYLEICLKEMEIHNSIACSGKVMVQKNNNSIQSILIFYMLTSSFGVSKKSYRTTKEGVGEQCPYPVFKRSVFNDVGMYNELLVRNQDNDMNYRIRKAGYRLYYTHKVSALYSPKQTIKGLFDYAAMTGKWNTVSLRVNPASLGLRHLIPLFFVLSLLLSLTLILLSFLFFPSLTEVFIAIFCIIIASHFLGGIISAFIAFLKSKKIVVLVLPFLFFAFHFLYGWGMLTGFFSKFKKS